jgi:hypothetical protein
MPIQSCGHFVTFSTKTMTRRHFIPFRFGNNAMLEVILVIFLVQLRLFLEF